MQYKTENAKLLTTLLANVQHWFISELFTIRFKETITFLFFNDSVKNKPILIIFGIWNPEKN